MPDVKLKTVARYADMWNAMGAPDFLRHKDEVLRAHCEAVGRDQAEIECTAGCKPIIRDSLAEARRVWDEQMAHNRTPMSDVETLERWIGEVKPMVERT